MKWLLLSALLALGSCASSDRWNAYDLSSYDVVMEPSDEEYAEHIELLEAWAADERQPIPPGLYTELGYWLAKVGRNAEARAAFEKELARYPYAEKYLATLTTLVLGAPSAEDDAPTYVPLFEAEDATKREAPASEARQ